MEAVFDRRARSAVGQREEGAVGKIKIVQIQAAQAAQGNGGPDGPRGRPIVDRQSAAFFHRGVDDRPRRIGYEAVGVIIAVAGDRQNLPVAPGYRPVPNFGHGGVIVGPVVAQGLDGRIFENIGAHLAHFGLDVIEYVEGVVAGPEDCGRRESRHNRDDKY